MSSNALASRTSFLTRRLSSSTRVDAPGSRHRDSEVDGVVVDVDRLEPLALSPARSMSERCCCRSIATCCPTGSPFTEVVVEDPECDDARILR
jgi:hypothetical protein